MRKPLLGLTFLLLILGLVLVSPDTPADDPQETTPTETPEAAEPPAEEPLEGPPGGEPLDTFEPTEKLTADSAVSFPVDI